MMPVVILAGGLATRMRPITVKIPKSLIDVAGRPFIYHQLSLLRQKGVTKVILCVGYLGKMIEDYVGDGRRYDLEVVYSYDSDKLLGTGGAVKKAERYLGDSFFVLYGDSYLDVDYEEIEETYHNSSIEGLMTIFKNENKWDTSNVVYENNEIIRYSKKNISSDMRYIDYGLGILSKEILRECENDVPFDIADVYEKLAEEHQLMGYEVFERFYEIGSEEGLGELSQKICGLKNVESRL